MRIQTELVKAKELNPGDLYSYLLPEYWDSTNDLKQVNEVIGEKVHIRTHEPWPDGELHIFTTKITIHKDDETKWSIEIKTKGTDGCQTGVALLDAINCPHRYKSPAGTLVKCRHTKHRDRRLDMPPDCSMVYCPIKR